MSQKVKDWNHFFYLNPKLKKSDIAMELSVSTAFFSKLQDPERYQPLVPDALCQQIAALWNQPVHYVRSIYVRAA